MSRTPQLQPPQVEQQVRDQLARTMVGDLPAAVDLDRGDAVVAQQVLAAAGEAQRVDGRVLGQPDFVGRAGGAGVGERLHRAPGRQVGGAAQRPDQRAGGRRFVRHQSTIDTSGCEDRSR
ncbi:MAG: hypothetical protein IPF60_14460 [Betaproteobacteria bacterium]|nr:hypothetical protein [Betaproteobacteria bacterium]